MTALLASSVQAAASLTGVWQLVEVNSLSMQDTPPHGQINRKEIYTAEGELLVGQPDAPFDAAQKLGNYEVHDDVRIFISPDGEAVQTAIQWEDQDHFFFEFSPGERWYYARVIGDDARNKEWEPRSVAVVRTSEDGSGPTLRHFPYDMTDDSQMPWAKRVLGAWETIKISGRAVSGPDMPPYGMPNDRLLLGADGILRKVHANGEADEQGGTVDFKVEGNQLLLAHGEVSFHFWFNHWGQLVLEQDGLQTVLKRVSFDAEKAPVGPIVIALLGSEREDPKLTNGKLIEIKKTAAPAAVPYKENASSGTNTSENSGAGAAASSGMNRGAAKAKAAQARPPKATFSQPYNGRSQPADLALAEDADSLQHENAINLAARKQGLGSTSEILETNDAEKFCTIRADAIDSDMNVPFGWHVADNGDRMLVFDQDHFIEISLEKQKAKTGPEALLKAVLDERKAAQPDVKSQLMDNGGGAFLLIMNNVEVESRERSKETEVKTLAYFTHDIGVAGETLVGRITASQADLIRALNLSEVLTRGLRHDS